MVNKDQFELLAATRDIHSVVKFNNNNILVTFSKDINMDNVKALNIDIDKAYSKLKIKSEREFDNVSVAISSAITAYGRIHISKLKINSIKLGGNLYYSDTDSLVTDKELPGHLVDNEKIGKLKLEYGAALKLGYFISNKTYCLVTKDDEIIKKAKGIDNRYIELEDYVYMYTINKPVNSKKITSIKDYKEGFVRIFEQNLV